MENCDNKLVLSNDKHLKISNELEEKKYDLYIVIGLLIIVSIILIVCLYMMMDK